MKNYISAFNKGFMFIELIVVIAVISALSSIAISNFAASQEKALAISCQSNRRNMEMDEQAYYLEYDRSGLTIDAKYSCPSNGVYVWLISDPGSADYPRVGCSVHYAYMDSSTSPIVEEETGTPPEPDPEPEPPEEDKTPSQLIDELITTVNSMDIPKKGIKNNLSKKLSNAKKDFSKGDTKKAIKDLNSFIKKVEKESKKNIKKSDAAILITQAETIINSV